VFESQSLVAHVVSSAAAGLRKCHTRRSADSASRQTSVGTEFCSSTDLQRQLTQSLNHIAQLLRSLRWLRLTKRSRCLWALCTAVFVAWHPPTCQRRSGAYLRRRFCGDFVPNKTRAFTVAAPSAWNCLSDEVLSANAEHCQCFGVAWSLGWLKAMDYGDLWENSLFSRRCKAYNRGCDRLKRKRGSGRRKSGAIVTCVLVKGGHFEQSITECDANCGTNSSDFDCLKCSLNFIFLQQNYEIK